jgi:hypothetical protein
MSGPFAREFTFAIRRTRCDQTPREILVLPSVEIAFRTGAIDLIASGPRGVRPLDYDAARELLQPTQFKP